MSTDSPSGLKASLIVLSCAVLIWLISKILKIGSREPYLPPGPPTSRILGNLGVFPTLWPWFKYTEWTAEYGEIYSLKIGPSTIVVISGIEAFKELMEKRSAATNERPRSYMADMVQSGMSLAFTQDLNKWRLLRKVAHVILSPQAIENHILIQRAEATQVLHDFLKAPEGFYTHLRRYASSVIMSVVYGKRSPRYDSPDTKAFFDVHRLWTYALEPWAHPPIDILPVLNYIPERWASWKRLAKAVRRGQRRLYFTLVDECEKRMSRGEENGCYMEEVLARQEEFQLTREMIGYLGGVLLEGGSETTAAVLQSLVLFLTTFPDVQRKAQEEIDAVIGHDRSPSLDDISDLPYIQALIKETHRFRPVTPLLIPHALSTAEEYRGYIIPKDTTILVNMYGIFHNPDYFEDPESFNPDRFLGNESGTKLGANVSDLVFGCGRRICPGMDLANNSLVLNTMNLLWAFDFCPPKDSEGKTLHVDPHEYEKGLVVGPRPFGCLITPRNDRVVEIIERDFKDATETFSKFEKELSIEDRRWVEEARSNG
ncbi:cytochrome P450 [Marasmius fiardii PR-910]|nr:cytochrome P450 [Marasmius fiardii PR-910]